MGPRPCPVAGGALWIQREDTAGGLAPLVFGGGSGSWGRQGLLWVAVSANSAVDVLSDRNLMLVVYC